MKKIILNILLVMALVLSLTSIAFADEGVERPLPAAIDSMRLDAENQPPTMDMTLDRSLMGATGPVLVSVHLVGDSVADLYKSQMEQAAESDTFPEDFWLQQRFQLKRLKIDQDQFYGKVLAEYDADAIYVSGIQRIFNAVMMEIDSAVLTDLANDPEIEYIAAVTDYEMDAAAAPLSEVVEYIGAADVHDMGYTGKGISIAILDTGIDYTHTHFGGSGSVAEYNANDETIIEPGTFPTAKVVGGYDFVGSVWPDGDLLPDPDPLDKPTTVAHGTHVGDIAAGLGGVAPGADLYAVKVCSSVSNACSGVALLNGMDFAIDPNGDGKLNDALDIVNMSLGANYGNPYYDDLSLAVNVATGIGVLTVTSAGNAADKPYILGTPANAPTALAVAATHVPTHILPLMEVTAPESISGLYPADWWDWTLPLTAPIEAPLQYGDGAGGHLDGCSTGDDPSSIDPGTAPFPPDSLDGKIVMVDRGSCNFSTKVYNIQRGGGLLSLVANNVPGSVNAGSSHDVDWTISGYMVSLDIGYTLKDGLPETVVKFDPDVGVPQVGTIEAFSSRGPSSWLNYIKPDIAAPADILAADAGTGDGTSSVSGTSSSSPVIAGVAALVKEKFMSTWIGPEIPDIPFYVKSMIVTNGDTDIRDMPEEFFDGDLSPISRIGGGEVRADLAVNAPITLYMEFEEGMRMPNLSFGLVDVTDETVTIHKRIAVNNLTHGALTYDVSSTFRFADDALAEAVKLDFFPKVLNVPAMFPGYLPEANLDVVMTIDGAKLNDWVMNSGGNGNNPAALTYNEIDGYVYLDDTSTTTDDEAMIHLPWMVLPRKSSLVTTEPDALNFTSNPTQVDFTNMGMQQTFLDQYDWIAHSPDHPPIGGMGDQIVDVDIKDIGVMTYPVPAGYCSANDSFILVFAITTYDRFPFAVPSPNFDIYLDVDQDGDFEYDIYNWDASHSTSLSAGQSLTWVWDIDNGGASAFFYLGHPTNSANFYFAMCGEQIGMNATNFFDPMDVVVEGWDWYYSGQTTDLVMVGTISPLGERYYGVGGDALPGETVTWDVYDFGPGSNPTSMGLLFLTGDSTAANENLTLEAGYP